MVSKETAGFINEVMDQVIAATNEMASQQVRLVEWANRCDDIDRKLTAAQDNLFATQRKLYAAAMLLNEVFVDYRDLNFKTKAGRKHTDGLLDRMRRFQEEYDIHIEQTEKGWVAK